MSQLKDAIRNKNDEFQKYFAENKIQDLVNHVYTEKCKFMPHGRPTIEGRKEVKEVLEGERNNVADSLSLTTVEINGTDEFAYEQGRYQFNKGTEKVDFGKYLLLVINKLIDKEGEKLKN